MTQKRNETASIILGKYLDDLFPGEVVREARFHEDRKWRFDFAVAMGGLAVELEGGIWVRGRHTTGAGFQSDLDKYNTASALGWTVFRFSTDDVLKHNYKKLEVLKLWRNQFRPSFLQAGSRSKPGKDTKKCAEQSTNRLRPGLKT